MTTRQEAFTITSVSREDIYAHFAESIGEEGDNEAAERSLRKRVDAITDTQMETLARKMADDYLEQLYWIQIDILAKDLVEGKK